jgi:hypothetical protein
LPQNLKSICLKISESLSLFPWKVLIDLSENLGMSDLKSQGSQFTDDGGFENLEIDLPEN